MLHCKQFAWVAASEIWSRINAKKCCNRMNSLGEIFYQAYISHIHSKFITFDVLWFCFGSNIFLRHNMRIAFYVVHTHRILFFKLLVTLCWLAKLAWCYFWEWKRLHSNHLVAGILALTRVNTLFLPWTVDMLILDVSTGLVLCMKRSMHIAEDTNPCRYHCRC